MNEHILIDRAQPVGDLLVVKTYRFPTGDYLTTSEDRFRFDFYDGITLSGLIQDLPICLFRFINSL